MPGAGQAGPQQGPVPSSLRAQGSPPMVFLAGSSGEDGFGGCLNAELKPLPPHLTRMGALRFQGRCSDATLSSSSLGTEFGGHLTQPGSVPTLQRAAGGAVARAGHCPLCHLPVAACRTLGTGCSWGNGEETAGLRPFPPLKQIFPGRDFANPSSQAEFLHLSPNRDLTPGEFTAPAPGLGRGRLSFLSPFVFCLVFLDGNESVGALTGNSIS